jgi:AraC-like DNA-binding protein
MATQTEAVEKMCRYIEKHIGKPITLKELATIAGYSPWYSSKMFKLETGKTPSEYIRSLRLSIAAVKIREERVKIVDAAFDSVFDSHEGFTRAFYKEFGVVPVQFQKKETPIRLFIPGVKNYRLDKEKNERDENMERNKKTNTVFVQVVERPDRKFIVKRGKAATEYFSYCEEVGCDVWEVLLNIKEAIDEPLGMWLPEKFRKPGTSEYIQGVQVAMDYAGVPPAGYEIVVFPSCKMMIFQGQPFPDEEYQEAIAEVEEAIAHFNPVIYHYDWAYEDGPRLQTAPIGTRGYLEARPVRKIVG